MELEQLLIDLCLHLQNLLNDQNLREHKYNEVFYSYSRIPHVTEVTYTASIYVNRTLVFKETYFREKIMMDDKQEEVIDEDLKQQLLQRLMRSVFNYGVMSSKKVIDERDRGKEIKDTETYLKQLKAKENDGEKTKGTDNY